MKKVRFGCIEVTLCNMGKVVQNRCTLPIPKEVAEKLNYENCQFIKGKWFFVKTHQDIEALWYEINLIQVTVNDWKVAHYEQKKQRALENCVNYKTK